LLQNFFHNALIGHVVQRIGLNDGYIGDIADETQDTGLPFNCDLGLMKQVLSGTTVNNPSLCLI
jgi:hypothetical protein